MSTTILQTPAPVSSLSIAGDYLFTGCDDGTLRVYSLSGQRNVLKAVRGLGSEVSSIACIPGAGSKIPDVWLACGIRVLHFALESTKMILGRCDALHSIEICSCEDDVLNEICLDENDSTLAFSSDSGLFGVVDLSTMAVKTMKTKHTSICGSVRFIPARPRELVSGGNILSQYDIPAPLVVGGTTLSPPFVLCLAISSNGLIAAGTADGRGIKRPSKKKSRKWNGLDSRHTISRVLSTGPIVCCQFSQPDVLTFSSLLGTIYHTRICIDEQSEEDTITKLWKGETENIAKVNALVVVNEKIVVGGIAHDGKGITDIIEIQISSAT
ncbi:WD40 repeat-like protein [Hymenopellis radicata]|nr:WD40 repeat-like protein [Hymenopellis radicata]